MAESERGPADAPTGGEPPSDVYSDLGFATPDFVSAYPLLVPAIANTGNFLMGVRVAVRDTASPNSVIEQYFSVDGLMITLSALTQTLSEYLENLDQKKFKIDRLAYGKATLDAAVERWIQSAQKIRSLQSRVFVDEPEEQES